MAYSLRLPDALDADARQRCQRLGISLNALLCVALDAYLRAPQDAPKQGQGDISAVTGPEPDGTDRPAIRVKPATAPAGIPKRSKAQRREITRLERAARKP